MSYPDPDDDVSPTSEPFDPAEDCDDPGWWDDNFDPDPPDSDG